MADVHTTQLRDALAWATNEPEPAHEASSNPFVWLWEAIEGDFNEDRTTGQILVDAGISMIPLVDQLCDVRDLIADCKKILHKPGDGWTWVALVLTLIGLFPTLGSLVKGVLKIFFSYVRRSGGIAIKNTVESAMATVVTFLRRREVQVFLKAKKVDEVFQWLVDEIKELRGKINSAAIIVAMDRGLTVLESVASRVSIVPLIGGKAKGALEQVKKVRLMADKHIDAALKPVQDFVNEIILALERQILEKQNGIVNAGNIHFRGVIPEAQAIAIIRKRKPKWVSTAGDNFFRSVEPDEARALVDKMSRKNNSPSERFPNLSDQSIASFHTLIPHSIRGPARLYRILSPGSRGMSDCWVTEEIFKKLQRAPDPKAAWRRHLAVWPDWNANGQFVIYDVKKGETLNTWRGPASSQEKKSLPTHHLEGGWEQIVFNIERNDHRADTISYYRKPHGKNKTLGTPLAQDEVDKITANMNSKQKAIFFEEHLELRESINHPNISGPFETGWGYSEFDGAGYSAKIGLPELPGQVTK
jgi:hypothetical protein